MDRPRYALQLGRATLVFALVASSFLATGITAEALPAEYSTSRRAASTPARSRPGVGCRCWGWNIFGQLGDGTINDSHVPVDVAGLATGVAEVFAG